ncbi:MAG: NAD(P)-dependent oxidoreductase [Armatimonadetes bacterium]|nr:NAD(P)-dependent oxidoreductase [Armatimonadota bacterium]
MKLGFIGMGIMGAPMARNLLKAGFDVTVWNRTAVRCEPLRDAGATVAADLGELARTVDIIFICVSDTPDVGAVLFGPDGLANDLRCGQIVVDMSTISPAATVDFATRLADSEVAMLDAPVSGGEKGAVDGTLTIMCGGDEAVFETVKPYFQAMGRNIVHCGPTGNGQRVKAVNQVICALNILAVSEGLLLAKRAGLDLQTAFDVVSSGAAASWMLTNLGPKIIAGDWAPGFTIRLQAKDLRIALETMRELGMAPEGTALTEKLFSDAVDEYGDNGTQGLVRLLGWDDE